LSVLGMLRFVHRPVRGFAPVLSRHLHLVSDEYFYSRTRWTNLSPAATHQAANDRYAEATVTARMYGAQSLMPVVTRRGTAGDGLCRTIRKRRESAVTGISPNLASLFHRPPSATRIRKARHGTFQNSEVAPVISPNLGILFPPSVCVCGES
jgi:hypothetical protein